MTDINQVQRLSDAVIVMIREDQGSGQIPADVSSLDELDNYVDIDDYYRRIHLPTGDHHAVQLRHAVDEEIGRRLTAAQGGPWHVIWRRPDGETQDIGKTTGYVTQEEAQAIGRAHLHSHGGGFHLCRAS
jgi:hypothetical protein